MARNYSAEYAARKERSLQRGLTVRQEQSMRQRARNLGLDPNAAPLDDFPLTSDERPHGIQAPYDATSPSPDWDYYWPTRTRNPQRKYTQMARYSRKIRTLEVVFRDGTPWHWSGVDPSTWNEFKREPSTYDFLYGGAAGRDDAPMQKGYGTGSGGGWGSIVGE